MPILKRGALSSFFNNMVVDHPTPSNISYLWNFGFLAGLALFMQIATGLLLAMHYVPHIDYAFLSVEHIMRDVNFGWLLRYLHANGASFFFIVVYAHMFRGIYYGSYSGLNSTTWSIGVTIYLCMMATAFLGYVLPWGQMSLWGATVITNFFSVMPFIGEFVVSWLWGGFSVNNATLNRFFSLHFFLPFVIAGLMIVHLVVLHEVGHNNPLGVEVFLVDDKKGDAISKIPFYPYFITKDLFGGLLFFFVLLFFVFFIPNFLGHPDNYIVANPLNTPPHIVPEWYFLPFYAILRSIPNKTFGVLLMFSSILIFYAVPLLGRSIISSSSFRPLHRVAFWFFVAVCLLLGWVGGNPIEFPFYELGQLCTLMYFIYFIVILPLFGLLEKNLVDSDG